MANQFEEFKNFIEAQGEKQVYYQGCSGGELDPSTLAKLEATGLYVAEPKYDGIWGSVVSNGITQMTLSRNGMDKGLDFPQLPAGSILVGEFGYGSEESKKRRAKIGHDFMDVFDVLFWRGRPIYDRTRYARREVLEEILATLTTGHYLLAPQWKSDFVKRFEEQAEGLVLKLRNETDEYLCNSKTKNWFKVKKEIIVDMVVMDYTLSEAATHKGKGVAKNVICGVYKGGKLVELVDVGTFPTKAKKELVKNFDFYKGKVVEIKCYKVFKSGSLRHPSLLANADGSFKIRDDKTADGCTWDGLMLQSKGDRRVKKKSSSSFLGMMGEL